jgi:LCP family protein required for cell wall assembly
VSAANSNGPSPISANKPRWGRVLGLTLAGILVFLLVFAFAAAKGMVPTSVVNGAASLFVGRQPGAVEWDTNQPANVLVMGLQIGGASTNPLTDSMMVVSYDPGAKSLSMLSIPRDLYVEIPGHGSGRINEAFEDGGAAEALLTVQQNLSIPVNYYALISYTAFEKLVDDLGGVTVDVPRDMNDPTYPADDEIHFDPFKISKGVHHLNGHEALRYARSRHADPLGDIGRAQRQQQILVALKEQALKPANILKLGLIMRDVQATVRTNFPLDQAAGLGLRVLQADKDKVQKGVLDYESHAITGAIIAGADVLAPNPKVIREITGKLFAPTLAYLKAGATVRVDNGSGYTGIATAYSRALANMGVKVTDPGDADRKDHPTAVVRAYTRDRAKMAEAKLLASMLGVALEQASGKESVDIVIILGKDYAPFNKFSAKDWDSAVAPQN